MLARAASAGWRLVRRRRRVRLALALLVVACPLLAGGWLWLRDSALVSVRRVQISGVQGPDATTIEAALAGAARRMSTLDVHVGALRAAVAGFPVVREVHASSQLPHGLRIRVAEQPPVAALVSAAGRSAVAADGVVLGPALLSGSLPTVTGSGASLTGRRVRGASQLGELAILGAAPAPLIKDVARVFSGPEGLTMAMRNGLLAYFGDASRPHAKWISLATVLSGQSSAGASYVDVRLPERPAAGFPAGAAPQLGSGSTGAAGAANAAGDASQESSEAALAAGLASNVTPESAPESGAG